VSERANERARRLQAYPKVRSPLLTYTHTRQRRRRRWNTIRFIHVPVSWQIAFLYASSAYYYTRLHTDKCYKRESIYTHAIFSAQQREKREGKKCRRNNYVYFQIKLYCSVSVSMSRMLIIKPSHFSVFATVYEIHLERIVICRSF
jgi:hypothetical protein